jgi:hypothetical protein
MTTYHFIFSNHTTISILELGNYTMEENVGNPVYNAIVLIDENNRSSHLVDAFTFYPQST